VHAGSFAVAVENAGTAPWWRGGVGPRLRGDDVCGEGQCHQLALLQRP